jgi:hypothetical protein
MNKATARTISERVMEALKGLEGDLGVTFSRGNGTFDSASFSMKITATVDNADGSTRTPEMVDFEREAHYYGLDKDHLGTEFTVRGETYKISGLKPRSRKYPILGTTADGRTFKFASDSVRRALGIETEGRYVL